MSHSKFYLPIIVTTFIFFLSSCKDNSVGPLGPDVEIQSENVVLNPTGYAPLSARIDIETNRPVRVSLRVAGQNGEETDIIHEFEHTDTNLQLPVLGLYPNYKNTVELTFFDVDGQKLGKKEYHIDTSPLLRDLPEIEINTAQRNKMAEGLTLVNYFGYHDESEDTPQRPFMFDSYGDIRWYMDFSSHPELSNLFYDVGPERLQNGNLYFGDGATNKIYEVDMLGNIINSWSMPGYGFHHEVTEKPNGNFLVTVNKHGLSTVEDHVIEIDRNSGSIINVWDLRQSLDKTRRTWETDIADLSVDWFHANAVKYDERDNTVIVSGRTQGVVKLTEDNEVVWILAPHKGWETSGNGTDLSSLLLQPLDSNDQPINVTGVLNGNESHPDFEWAWYQHAPTLMPNGNLMLFDNGENRNYTNNDRYSRAVEYNIDKENMTIKQEWSYGKERGGETYSRIVSDVDYYADEGHVYFSPGATSFGGRKYGKAIEMDYQTQDIIFEATIIPPKAAYGIITMHRTERLSIYPE